MLVMNANRVIFICLLKVKDCMRCTLVDESNEASRCLEDGGGVRWAGGAWSPSYWWILTLPLLSGQGAPSMLRGSIRMPVW